MRHRRGWFRKLLTTADLGHAKVRKKAIPHSWGRFSFEELLFFRALARSVGGQGQAGCGR